MSEKIKTLLEEMSKNEKLQEEIKEAKDLDSLYAITKKYVDGYSKGELKDLIEKLKSAENVEGTELSDNDLDAVAGGGMIESLIKVGRGLLAELLL